MKTPAERRALAPHVATEAQRILDRAARRILAENLAASKPKRRAKARAA